MRYKIGFILAFVFLLSGEFIFGQITAPNASASFQTTYSSGYTSGGGTNDMVYIFCGNQDETNIGELVLNAPGCEISWYEYDGMSFVPMTITGSVASNLESGFYMGRQNCGGTITCYRAWVWVNRTFAEIDGIPAGCETFTLNGQAQALDNSFDINDPPGSDFIVDANTYIKVCFWATHSYVSDIGFYLKSPGSETANPGEVGVVQLCPAASDWGPSASQGSWTGIPWSALGCSDASDENTVCNSGNNVGSGTNGFCFQSHSAPGGSVMAAGTPSLTPCVCDLPTPLTGNFASVGEWNTIYGAHAAEPGWSVQIYDCENADIGSLTRATIIFTGETDCGSATFTYDSGTINSAINDNSCSAPTASIYVVPPGIPAGSYTITSAITSTEWTSDPVGFTSTTLSNEIVQGTPSFPDETTDYILTVTETINVAGNPTCETTSTETFVTLPADATITPVNPLCTNDMPAQLTAADGGGTWTTTAPAGSISSGYFYPEVAGPGTYTVTYTITGACDDSDQITIIVYDNIEIVGFSDEICSGDNTQYFVTFDVIYAEGGGDASFDVDLGTGSIPYNGTFAGAFPTNTIYNITVTDSHGCSEFEFHGLTNCGCETDAGDMTSLSPVILCADECTDVVVAHQGNQQLDTDDMFEFIIHDGAYPANIYAYNTTPDFCFSDISGAQYGVTYYVSAICGNASGGHVSQADPCYSQSIGTPVVWFANPIAHISETELSTCGLTITLEADPPTGSLTGTWSADGDFVPTGGTTINDPTINVMTSSFGDVNFVYTLSNGICYGSDNVLVHFNQTPNAYAGEDFTICGIEADLTAVFSLVGSNGTWTGPGSFTSQSSPETTVTSSVGQQIFTWRESQGICWDEDYITVTFLAEPSPTTVNTIDTTCSNIYDLHVFNSEYEGQWTAYEGDPLVLMVPAPIYTPSATSPDAQVMIGNYVGLTRNVVFVWTETNETNGIECTGEASVEVTFAREPLANVGPSNQREICGNCVTFEADLTGSEWATEYFWIPKVNGEFTNPEGASSPTATFCVDVPAAFGDSAYIDTQFYWAVKNGGCVSIDTMHVIFYQQPVANAGIDDAICGNNYELEAFFDITETLNYVPEGIWSVYNAPVGQSANFAPTTNDTSLVTVSQVGIWNFVFRENNANASYCYSTDTVQIEFVEVPVIFAGEDKDVCGTATEMEGVSGGYTGSWLPTAGATFTDYTSPTTPVNVGVYDDLLFTWMESNQAQTSSLACTVTDDVLITFWRVPSATIQTDEADSTVCGLTFEHLRAELSGTEILGYWYSFNPAADFLDEFDNNTSVTMPSYGYHDFYWIEETGPGLTPGFCNDTAGPLTIRFIEIPHANAGGDTLFCGKSGYLNAIPSIGTGVWSTPSASLVLIENHNDPQSFIESEVYNSDNLVDPYFSLIWTEDNSNGCTNSDTMRVVFARVPSSEIDIIEPKCFGEPATIAAAEDSLQQYSWNFYSGLVDSVTTNTAGGLYEHFVYWNSEDTAHEVSLIATNYWGCQSPINIDTIQEPPIPSFDITFISDTCALGKGGIIFGDTLGSSAFFWIDPNVGPEPGPITTVYNLPAGEYGIYTSYLTPNIINYAYYLSIYHTANCLDTIYYEIETIGMIDAEMSVSADVILEDLVAPNAVVTFLNTSDYDDVSKRCEWHFDDGTVVKSCDEMVEHIYTESGCYEPFLIVMNRDLPECRDTAVLEACIFVDDASKLEIPNIFSPNGDGVNDFFQVKAQTLRTFSGVILNRWGRTVYTWENWQEYEAGWNGVLSGGTKASPGVYYYVITAEGLDGTPYDEHGALHLVRE